MAASAPDIEHLRRLYTSPHFLHDPLPRGAIANLERYRQAIAVGNYMGLLKALEWAVREKPSQSDEELRLVPRWVLVECHKYIQTEGDGSRGTGRHADWRTKWRDDNADLWRVHSYLLAKRSGHRGYKAFDVASDALQGTYAAGTPDTIRAAWKRFKRRQKDDPYRYVGSRLRFREG